MPKSWHITTLFLVSAIVGLFIVPPTFAAVILLALFPICVAWGYTLKARAIHNEAETEKRLIRKMRAQSGVKAMGDKRRENVG